MKQTKAAFALLAVVFIAAGCSKATTQNNEPTPTPLPSQAQESTPLPTPSKMSLNQPSPTTPTATAQYKDYSADAVAKAQQENKRVVLFFHAAWCPTCIAANKAFNANTNQLPADVVLLKTDYDTETTLKKKYAITYQHTFVQIDASGNQISKWTGGDVESLKKYLK